MSRPASLNVLVVDDSRVVRRLVVGILASDPDIRVVGEAGNGLDGVRLAERLRPDVITMDIHMPVMDGVAATRQIMDVVATPIVVVTSSTNRGEAGGAFRALEAGALTVLDKPAGPGSPQFSAQAKRLVDTVKLMAEVKVVSRRRRPAPPTKIGRPPASGPPIDVVAVAASTGGPVALATILRALPHDTPVPILVVQHIAPGFEESLAAWLNDRSPLSVRLAADGERLRPGEVILAPRGRHLGVDGARAVALSAAPPVGSYRPSATHLFQSVANAYGRAALGVMLTGMGNDGVEGLVPLKQAGGRVLAQDEATSVVYGMPCEAAARGLTDDVLGLGEIPSAIVALWRRRSAASETFER